MNPFKTFLNHFAQCKEAEAEFHFNGTPYKGAWPKQASMQMFLKDLIEEVEDENGKHEEALESLNTEIENLEADLKEARA